MKLFSLKIKDKDFKVAVVSTEESMKKGLSGKPELGAGKGMLFDFREAQTVTMNMEKMLHPIDMIFIGEGLDVIDVRAMRPGDAQTSCKDCMLVLEVKKGEGKNLSGEVVELSEELTALLNGEAASAEVTTAKEGGGAQGINIIINVSGIVPPSMSETFKKGGTFKIYEDQVAAKDDAMQVLDDTGKILMNIVGGERIFSIKHTEKLVELAKKVEVGEAEEADLGALMAEIIEVQNTQEPEYV